MLIDFPTRKQVFSTYQVWHQLLRLRTESALQFIDLTDEIISVVQNSGIITGLVNIQTRHTTTAIVINEYEPLLLEDMRRTLEHIAPCKAHYRHDDFSVRTHNLTPDEQPNGHAHCKSLFLRASETINVVNARPDLGLWQRVFLIELDRARERTVSVMVSGQSSAI